MKKTNLVVSREDIKVVDGNVVISSEELAAAIQNYDVNLNEEEMAEGIIDINFFCPSKK